MPANEKRRYFGLTNQRAFRCWNCWPMRTENTLDWPIRELLNVETVWPIRALLDIEYANQWEERIFALVEKSFKSTEESQKRRFLLCYYPILYDKNLIAGPLNLMESLANRSPDFLLSNFVLPSDWSVSWSLIKLWLVSFDHACCVKYISLFSA